MSVTALEHLRVVDLSRGVAGAYATKLFADAGADVVVVEAPEGTALRRTTRQGPLAPGVDGPLFRFLAAGKRATVGSLDDPAVRALALGADVVVEDFPAGTLEAAGLLPDPANVVVSITPYGRGPLQDQPANEFTAQAVSGSIAARGAMDGDPLHAAGRLAELAAGIYAAPAAAIAARELRRSGRGAHIDVSCAEAAVIATNLFQDLMFRMIGFVPPIPGRMIMFPGVEETSDGWVGLNTNSRQKLDDLLAMVGRDDLIAIRDLRSDPAVKADYEGSIRGWLAEHTTAEVLEMATLLRIPVAPIGNGETLPHIDHFRETGTFTDEVYGDTAPRPYYSIDGQRPRPRAAAPALDERVAPEAITPAEASSGRPSEGDGEPRPLPLDGLKVVDLTAWWAGPSATQLLASLGADVIHVESIQVIDGMRPAASQAFATTPDWWERSSFFLNINTNKRGITLDLTSERGRELARDLVAWADVLVENYTPRVVENWGLDWDSVHALNPGLIMCRMPAFGLTGPWSDRVGFAQTMEQVSGLSWITGYRGGGPMMPNGPCDPLGGMHAAFAIVAALTQRDETGAGSLVEVPLVESALNLAAEEVLEFSAFGRVGERFGNRSPEQAPQGVYRCTGDEQWVALSVEDDAQWRALVDVLGSPDWASRPELDDRGGRWAAHDELDGHLEAWFAGRERDAAVGLLVAAGVTAAPVLDHRSVVTQDMFVARGFAQWCDHPVVGRHPLMTLPYTWTGIPQWITRPAPTLGQHNEEVLTTVLGLSAEEIATLEDDDVIGTRPLGL